MKSTELKTKLKYYRGSFAVLKERTGFSRQYIRMVLDGKSNNFVIIEAATTLLSELNEKRKSIEAQVAQVLEQA